MASEKQRKLMFAKAHQAGLEIDWKECIQWEQGEVKAWIDKCDAVIGGEEVKPFNSVGAKAPVEKAVEVPVETKVPVKEDTGVLERMDWEEVKKQCLSEKRKALMMIEVNEHILRLAIGALKQYEVPEEGAFETV